MRIAIDARMLADWRDPANAEWKRGLISEFIQQGKQHKFLIVTNEPGGESLLAKLPATFLVLRPVPFSSLGYWLWYNVRLPYHLRKWKADVFIGWEGVLSMKLGIPQVLLLAGLPFLHQPQWMTRGRQAFFNRHFAGMLQRAAIIFVVGERNRNAIESKFANTTSKLIGLQLPLLPGYTPLAYEERSSLKDKVTGGADYFLCAGPMHIASEWINVLKAFSQFKKMQRSQMKLVMVSTTPGNTTDLESKLATYRYREDVIWKAFLGKESLHPLIACAYALVYPCRLDGIPLPVWQALLCGIPAIVPNEYLAADLVGPAGLAIDIKDASAIADSMKRMYKDETLRTKMALAAQMQVASWSLPNPVMQLWQSVESLGR